MKRIISIGLMYLVLLSSVDCTAEFGTEIAQDEKSTLVVEESHGPAKEFRESIKLNLSEETKSHSHVVSHKPALYWFNAFQLLQSNNYQRIFQSSKPSSRLFIDFGALLI